MFTIDLGSKFPRSLCAVRAMARPGGDGELEQLKSRLRSLVVSSPAQVDASGLARDYRLMMGEPIPCARHGYRDYVAFLREKCADCFLVPILSN